MYVFFQAILIVRKVLMVAIYIFVHDTILRLNAMLLLLTVSLVIHQEKKPFKSSVLNSLETVFLALLILMGIVNNFWAGQYRGVPASRLETAQNLLIAETVIVILPIPVLLVLIAYNKYTERKKRQLEDKMK